MKKHIKIILALLLIVLIAAGTLTACDNENAGEYTQVEVNLKVVDNDGNVSDFTVHVSSNSTVGDAFRMQGIITERDFITTVNGITADWDANGAWWMFTIDDEMAIAGVDDTTVEAGATYAFVYTTD